MKKLFITGLAAVSATLAACGEQPVTGVSADPLSPMMAIVETPASQRICSGTVAGNGGFVAIDQNPNWITPIDPDGAGLQVGTYVGPTPTSDVNYTKGPTTPTSYGTYLANFTLPGNATNISISGNMSVDNDATIAVNVEPRFYSTFPGGDPAANTYIADAPEVRTEDNFRPGHAPDGGLPFSTSTGFNPGPNTVAFTVYNDNNPDDFAGNNPERTNPTGLSFCFTVNYTLITETQDGNRGCSPGYWKNHLFPAGYAKDQAFNSNIPGDNFANAFPGKSFQDVLSTGGGGLIALGRHTVSAYFNAVVFGEVAYGMSAEDVVDEFNAAYASGNAAEISALANKFASMEDVGGRTCNNPTGKAGGKK